MTIKSFEEDTHPEEQNIIIPFSGTISEIPVGWVLADGSLGTLNMSNRFIRGQANYSSSPGSTGGEHTKNLYGSQIPNHSHNASVDTDGNHRHGYVRSYNYVSGSDLEHRGSGSNGNTRESGSHSHGSSNTANTGNSAGIDNRPKFVEVAFIQKL